MGTTHQLTDHRSFTRIAITLLATLSLLASQVVAFTWLPAADAAVVGSGTDGGGFEIDGNFVVDGDGSKDWAAVDYALIPDGNTVFGGGNNAQEPNRQNWSFQSGTATPPKDNLLRGYVDSDIDVAAGTAILRVAAERQKGNGTAWASFEFNQANEGPFVSGTSVPRTPSDGDLLVSFQFPGNNTTEPEVIVDEWVNGSWSGVAVPALGATNLVSITSIESGAVVDDREFLEVSVNVSSLLFGPDAACRSFGQAWVRSNTAYGDNGQLKDVLLPVGFEFDTCAVLTLKKQATDGTPQAGVTFELYEGAEVEGTPFATCTTGAGGACEGIEGLEPGTWTAYEVAPPPGFRFDAENGRSQTLTLTQNEDRTVTFSNPPISYAINVTPEDDTNAVGFSHEFKVELFTDFLFDYETNTVDEESEAADIPLAGETVQLSWVNGPNGSVIIAVKDANGTTSDLDATATSCVTAEDGTCSISVLSTTVGGPGTLQATYDTPLSGPAASDPANATVGGYFSSITDSGDKSWIGYVGILEGAFDNPLGIDHTFTVAIDQVNADGSTQPAGSGVDVTVAWNGPTGSAIDGSPICTTGDDSTCDITVTSPSVPGTGTLSVVQVEGEIVQDETLTITYGDDAPSATKTWWDWRVTVEDDAVNPVSESHTFTVTVETTNGTMADGELVWSPATDGTTVDVDWSGVGDIVEDGDTCADGTVGGTCTVTVSSDEKGSGTLSATGITTTLGGYNLEGGVAQPFAYDVDDDEATKDWVDWIVDITPDAFNPAGTEHTFTVTVQVWDLEDEAYADVPDGTTLSLSYSDDSLVDDDSSCTVDGTADSTCTITAKADSAALLIVTVTGISWTNLPGYPENDGVATFTFGEDAQAKSTKQWIEYRILADDDATNHVSLHHTFTLTVQQTTVEPDERDDDADSDDWISVPNGTTVDVSVAADGFGSVTGGTCETETIGGTCTVVVASGGSVGSLTVIADGLSVVLFDGQEDTVFDVEVDAAEQTKTWIDYLVTFEPPAVNLLGDDHDFTVLVERVLGSDGDDLITEPANGVEITLAWGGADGSLVGGDEDGEVTVTTDELGEVTVTVTSPDAPLSGSLSMVSLTEDGEVELPVGGLTSFSYTNDETGDKTWIVFDLNLSGDALNPAGASHTFTIRDVVVDDGSADAPMAADGAVIAATWSGDAADADPRTCTVDAEGDCNITVPAPVAAGSGTLTMLSLTYTYDGEEFTVDLTDADGEPVSGLVEGKDGQSAVKTWRHYRASIDGDAVNLAGDPHTFTVTIEQTDDNETWSPVPDGTVIAPDGYTLSGALLDDVTVSGTCFASETEVPASGGTVDGDCTLVVDAGDEVGEVTVTVEVIQPTIETGEDRELGDFSSFTLAEGDQDSASKTWIEVDVAVSGDAVNNLGADHDFTVTVTVDDGSEGAPFEVEGAKVEGEFVYDEPDLPDLTGLTCTTDASGACDLTVAAPLVDGAAVAGEGTLTVTDVSVTYAKYGEDWGFDLDLTDDAQLGVVAGFVTPSSSKIWAAYTLTVTPPTDTNLLPGNEDHTYTVTLSSDDTDALPIGGQELDLTLTSDVVDMILVSNADGTDVEVPVDATGVTSFTCTTLEDGTCVVAVTTTGAGTATLTADFSTEIAEETFAADQAQGDKLWTTYRIRVENSPAVNLLGTPHVFDIYLEKTDGERDDADQLIWYGVDVDGEDLDISLSEGDAFVVTEGVGAADCAAGTDGDGFCTVTIDSTSTGLFTLTVGYTASNVTWAEVTQTAGFSETGTKRWIDFRVTMSDDAENLVDTDHVFEVLVEADFGEGFGPVEGALPAIDVAGVGTQTTSVDPALPDCADGTGEDGVCFVTITSSVPGTTTVTATYEGSTALASDEGTVGEPETADFVDSGDKLWVDYLLEVSEDAINALDDPHEFTITLLRDEGGEAPFPATGQEIDLTLEGVGTITSIVAGGVAEDGLSATCTTNEGGTCIVTIVSSEPGTSTLTARYDAVVGETSGTFTDEGVKQWAAISLVKEAQVELDEDGLKVVIVEDGETDTVTYDYTITNIGPVALTITELDDDVIGAISLPEDLFLQPGESAMVTADYTFTADDIAAGVVVNVADVVGVAEDGTEVTDRDDETVFVVEVLDVVLEPGIEVVKEALIDVDEDGLKTVTVGDDGTAEIVYRYTITNTGDAQLFNVTLTDDVIGDLTDELSVTFLAVGESTVVEVPYTTTAAELAAGRVDNIATTTGTTVEGATAEAQDDETVFLVEVLDTVEPLPKTGADTWLLTAVGLLLTLLGAATLLLGTRRRQHGEA